MQRVAVFVVLAVAQWLPWIFAGVLGNAFAALPGVVLFAALVWWAVRRSPAPVRAGWGLSPARPAGRLLGLGLAAGLGVYAVVFALRVELGGGRVQWAAPAEIALILGAAVLVAGYQALSEEIVFRGAVFALAPPRWRVGVVMTVSTALFVAFHLPRVEALVTGPYVVHLVLAGVAFALAYLRTGSLWLGVGLHAGWNLGAYLLREGSPPLVVLDAGLPEGWLGWSSWLSVAGNAALLGLVLLFTRRVANIRRVSAENRTDVGESTVV